MDVHQYEKNPDKRKLDNRGNGLDTAPQALR